ncbi:IclR family transcriptional regulator C-terminal domain-containing protein [Myceligenerans halotolerans]
MNGTAAEDGGSRPGEFVQSLERGLAVIRAFGAAHPAMTLSEVARETGLSRASARRFLHTLVELGYVATDGRCFTLRPRALELGYAYLSGLTLPEVAQPHLEALSEQVGESTSVAVLDDADVVYVARVATHRIMSAAIQVGTRFPAYATSMGRAVLAGLDDDARDDFLARAELRPLTPRTLTTPDALRAELARVREQGYALVDQELEEGLRSLAVPLRGTNGDVVAAVNVSAPVRRGDVETLVAEILPPLRKTAAEIEADLQRVP